MQFLSFYLQVQKQLTGGGSKKWYMIMSVISILLNDYVYIYMYYIYYCYRYCYHWKLTKQKSRQNIDPTILEV